MLDIFEFKDAKLGLTIDVLAHPILRRIYDRDEDRHKGEALMQYTYLNYMCSFKKSNPFNGYPNLEERRIKIIASIYKERTKEEKLELLVFYTDDPLLNLCIEVLDKIYETSSPSLRVYKAAIQGAHKVSEFMNTVNLNSKTNSGSAVYKPSDVIVAIKDAKSMVIALNDLKNAVDSELIEASKTVKNRGINYFEMVEHAAE